MSKLKIKFKMHRMTRAEYKAHIKAEAKTRKDEKERILDLTTETKELIWK